MSQKASTKSSSLGSRRLVALSTWRTGCKRRSWRRGLKTSHQAPGSGKPATNGLACGSALKTNLSNGRIPTRKTNRKLKRRKGSKLKRGKGRKLKRGRGRELKRELLPRRRMGKPPKPKPRRLMQ